MPAPRRVSRVVLLGAFVLFGACGDEPAPQHPTHVSKKKHKKKHADSDAVVVSDDSGGDEVASADDDDKKKHARKKHDDDTDSGESETKKKKDDDEDTKAAEREAKKKKKHEDDAETKKKKHDDDEDTKKAERAEKKKRDDEEKAAEREAKKKDDDEKAAEREAKKKRDEDEDTKKSDRETVAKADDDANKSDADEDARKADEPPKKPAKKPAKHPTKRKRVAAAKTTKTAKTEPATDPGEIEMDDEPPAGSKDTAAGAGGDDADEAAPGVAAPMPGVAAPMPAPATTSPLAINDRALVARHGALDVHGGLRTVVLTLPGAMPGTTTSSTSEGLALGAAYGVADKAEIGVDYVVGLSPGAIKGPLTLHGAYLASVGPKLDVAVAGALAVDFLDSTDPTTMTTITKTAYALQFGGWVRYRVAPKATLFTGLPALPAATASLSKLSFALPPLPYQLAIGLSNGSAIALDVPVGVGYQLAPAIYAFAMTDVAHVKISNTANAFLFADFIPLTVGGFYSRDKLDLGATLGDDLKQGFGYLNFQLLVRYAIQ